MQFWFVNVVARCVYELCHTGQRFVNQFLCYHSDIHSGCNETSLCAIELRVFAPLTKASVVCMSRVWDSLHVTNVSRRSFKCLALYTCLITINSDYFPKQHYPVGFCNVNSVCLLWGRNCISIQGDSRGKANILGGDSVGHCEEKQSYVSISERLLR
jgi:hypothetical protein